jgi:transcriptional regulator with XRE-family HTH domain
MPQAKVNVQALYASLDAKRVKEQRSWREIAHDLGISPSTFSRLANGARPDVDTFATLLGWLGMEAAPFIDGGPKAQQEADPAAMIASYLHGSDRVTPQQARALEDILQAAYRSIVGPAD